MKVLIPTHNRASSVRSHELFYGAGWEWRYLVHEHNDYIDYARAGIPTHRLFISGAEPGGKFPQVWEAIDFLRRINTVRTGDWVVIADDDLHRIVALPEHMHSEFHGLTIAARREYEERAVRGFYDTLKGPWLLNLLVGLTVEADRRGAGLAGLGWEAYKLGSKKRWSEGMAYGGLVLYKVRNEHPPIPIGHDDTALSAFMLAEGGGVLIDNHHLAVHDEYTPGGYGVDPLKRQQRKYEGARWLLRRYPGMFGVYDRTIETPEGARVARNDLEFKLTNPAKLRKWREEWSKLPAGR